MGKRHLAAVVIAGLVVAAAGCGDDGGGTEASAPTATLVDLEVRTVETTYVDDARGTPRSGDVPSEPTRTIETTTFLPEGEGPYPLLVFSHGLSATVESYRPLLERIAGAGFVVVAPTFPLTNADAPAGPDPGDTQNQPGDVSFLVDTVQAAVEAGEEPFADRVDPELVGAFGHSNGAITTLGVTANTCCRDERIDAAAVLSGTPAPFGDGEYDYDDVPPMLLVHGTADVQVAHESAVRVFNELDDVKGLLSMPEVDHTEFLAPGGRGFDAAVATIQDFFRSQLLGDEAAAERLAAEEAPGGMELHWAAEDPSSVTLPTLPEPDRQASADPTEDLTGGQLVTVSWESFTAGQVVNVVQCSQGGRGGNDVCDLTNGQILQPNPTGSGSLQLEIIVGPVGSGRCDASTDDCVIVVNDAGLPDEDATIRIPISFAD